MIKKIFIMLFLFVAMILVSLVQGFAAEPIPVSPAYVYPEMDAAVKAVKDATSQMKKANSQAKKIDANIVEWKKSTDELVKQVGESAKETAKLGQTAIEGNKARAEEHESLMNKLFGTVDSCGKKIVGAFEKLDNSMFKNLMFATFAILLAIGLVAYLLHSKSEDGEKKVTGLKNDLIGENGAVTKLKEEVEKNTSAVDGIKTKLGETNKELSGMREACGKTAEAIEAVAKELGDLKVEVAKVPENVKKELEKFNPDPITVNAGGYKHEFRQSPDAKKREVYQILLVDGDVDASEKPETYQLHETKSRKYAHDSLHRTLREYHSGKLASLAEKGDLAAQLTIALVEHYRDKKGQLDMIRS